MRKIKIGDEVKTNLVGIENVIFTVVRLKGNYVWSIPDTSFTYSGTKYKTEELYIKLKCIVSVNTPSKESSIIKKIRLLAERHANYLLEKQNARF